MVKTQDNKNQSEPGLAVDSKGDPVVDPSINVIALNAAANRRQDDLRIETTKRIDAALAYNEELVDLRNSCAKEVAALREAHSREIREIETKRLDAVHQVNVLAGTTAADRAQVAIQTLAATAATERETLRILVSTTATTIAAQNAAQMSSVTERIAALEKSSYEGAGKQKIGDPMLAELIAEMKVIAKSNAAGSGRGEGMKDVWGWIFGAAAFGAAVAALFALVK